MLKNRHSLRSFTAFLVTWAFLVLTITGIVLYVVPQGRVAYWMDWTLLRLGKDAWADLHMIFGGIFIAAGVLHLYFNWKPFRKYLGERVAGRLRLTRELLSSLIVSLAVTVFAIAQWPPVSWVFDLNDAIKDAWVESPEHEPPFGHAEQFSLAGLALRQNIDLDAAIRALRQEGVELSGPQQRLEDIAAANGRTPMDVYRIIRPYERPRAPPELLTAETVDARYAGTGIGRKTLAQISGEVGVDLSLAHARLAAASLQASDEETLKDIADRHAVNPMDVLKVILLEDWRPQ